MKSATKLLLLALLASCTSHDTSDQKISLSKISSHDASLENFKKADNSIVLLIPMSGPHKEIGQNVLNACVLGNQNSNMDIHVIDTNDYSDDLNQSSFQNLKAVVGPVFFQESYKFASIFQKVPLFSLSNNVTANNGHIYACGLSPQEEIETIFRYCRKNRLRSLTIFVPEGDFFKSISLIVQREAAKYEMDEENFSVVTYNESANLSEIVQNSNSKAIFAFEPVQSEKAKVFTLSSLALSNPEKWEGAMFVYTDNEDQRAFIEEYKKVFHSAPTVISLAAYDVIKMINESSMSHKEIFDENYQGTLGNFKIKKDGGIIRDLKMFKIEKAEKVLV